MDKHCYCEKPLAHSVYEARVIAELAKRKNVATQIGTQMHATDNYRRAVELVTCGAIGPVSEVHVWCGKDRSVVQGFNDLRNVGLKIHLALVLAAGTHGTLVHGL